jgi:sec-independent protein translocase protein TatA
MIIIFSVGGLSMFDIGMPELIVILIIALLVFGAGKLPEIGTSLGKAVRGFKKALSETESDELKETKDKDQKKIASRNS